MSFEKWLARLESFPWWDAPTEWARTAFTSAWFVKEPDAEGSFLVETKYDTYDVFPPKSYSVNDSYYDEAWWEQEGQQVSIDALGKWQFLYGLEEVSLPDASSRVPQEVGVILIGGWRRHVNAEDAEADSQEISSDPETFREYLSQTIGVSERKLWVFACLLDSYNLGFAIVPKYGQIHTYEMTDLEVATANPETVIASRLPSVNLRNSGVGITSYSFSVSGTGNSHPVEDAWYEDMKLAINRALTSPQSLLAALSQVTRWTSESEWTSGGVEVELQSIRDYLNSPEASRHFGALESGGYAVAIIPLGGRTIWRP